jgi:hypothetical protein
MTVFATALTALAVFLLHNILLKYLLPLLLFGNAQQLRSNRTVHARTLPQRMESLGHTTAAATEMTLELHWPSHSCRQTANAMASLHATAASLYLSTIRKSLT